MEVIHLPSGKRRRVTGVCAVKGVVQFAQVIKTDGETFYWALVRDCMPLLSTRGM